MVDISFVIVSWNALRKLLECLYSIYGTVHGLTFEVIVVDNCSTDGSPVEVRKRFPMVRLFEIDQNLGFACANNIGMGESKGRYLCLANSDTFLLDGCVDSLFRTMENHLDIGLAGPMVLNPDFSYQPSFRRQPTLWNYISECLGLNAVLRRNGGLRGQGLQSLPRNDWRPVEILSGCFLFARRAAVDMVGTFDERFFMYGEDVDWSIRFHAAGWRVVYHSTAKVIHHGGASSSLQPLKFYIHMCRSDLLLWAKYHGRLSHSMLLFVLGCHYCLRLLIGLAVYLFRSDKDTVGYKIRRSRIALLWLLRERPGFGEKRSSQSSAI